MMKILSQRDPAWSRETLGNTPFLVGRFGCLITCVSMLSSYYHCYNKPGNLAKTLKYTKDARLYWSSCKFPNFNFVWRRYGFNKKEIDKSLLGSWKTSVVLQVDHSHWVVAIGRSIFGGYRIADPWTGKKSTTRKYGQITGSAHFSS